MFLGDFALLYADGNAEKVPCKLAFGLSQKIIGRYALLPKQTVKVLKWKCILEMKFKSSDIEKILSFFFGSYGSS